MEPSKITAFVSHYDCARHDTGWGHSDHQGRLPALTRAVYRDMIALNDPLLDLEGRHATLSELGLVHDAAYLQRVRSWVEQAADEGGPVETVPGTRISGATWDAASAAVGTAITAAEAVLDGRVRNAFCAVRPPGAYAGESTAEAGSIFNTVAILARWLVQERTARPVLVIEIGAPGPTRTGELLQSTEGIEVATLSVAGADGQPGLKAQAGGGAGSSANGNEMVEALQQAAEMQTGRQTPAFVVLAVDFSTFGAAAAGGPGAVYQVTEAARAMAEEWCDGRLVSVLEGGSDARVLGAAAVQHLRALTGLPPADG